MLISLLVATVLYGIVHFYPAPSMQPTPHARYTKIAANGVPLTPWQGPWACVLDRKLNVLWEVKTDNESIHDGYWTYSWFLHEKGQENFGDCYFESQRCDTQDLIERTNIQTLCGQNNWRLPTEQELASLIQSPSRPGRAHIADDYFSYINQGDYWTSQSDSRLSRQFKHLKLGAKAINFHSGTVNALPYRNAAFVILVSSLTKTHPLSQFSSRDNSIKQK
nr:DUF1566 domain-containing protein [Pseudoalteromonas caenipelagi]